MDADFWTLDRKITYNDFKKLQCCNYLFKAQYIDELELNFSFLVKNHILGKWKFCGGLYSGKFYWLVLLKIMAFYQTPVETVMRFNRKVATTPWRPRFQIPIPVLKEFVPGINDYFVVSFYHPAVCILDSQSAMRLSHTESM